MKLKMTCNGRLRGVIVISLICACELGEGAPNVMEEDNGTVTSGKRGPSQPSRDNPGITEGYSVIGSQRGIHRGTNNNIYSALTTPGPPRYNFSCPPLSDSHVAIKNCTCVRDYTTNDITSISCLSANISSLMKLNISEFRHVRHLSVQRDNLGSLSAENMPDFPNLVTLDLQKNHIHHVEADVFDKFPNITSVELSWNAFVDVSAENYTDLDNLFTAVRNRPVFRLFVVKVSGGAVCSGKKLSRTLSLLQGSNIKYFAFAYNPIDEFADGLFSPMSNLEYLDLRFVTQQTTISRINTRAFQNLTRLTMLQLQGNDLKNISTWIDGVGKAVLPNLTSLFLDFNIFTSIEPRLLKGLENLERLTLDGNCAGLTNVSGNNFAHLQNLRELSLAGNKFQVMSETAFNIPSLETLDLTDSKFTFYQMPKRLLRWAPSITSLKLSGLSSLLHSSSAIKELLADVPLLEYVELQALLLVTLDKEMFRNLTCLTYVNLAHNLIQTLPRQLFRDNTNLSQLLLGDNKITTIHRLTFTSYVLDNLLVLDLSGNPLACVCELSWFRAVWMERDWRGDKKMADKLYLDYRANDTACGSPPALQGLNLGNFTIDRDACLRVQLPVVYVALLSCSFLFMLLALFVALAFRLQWHFKYWCFNLKARYWAEAPPPDEGKNHKFDVFVSYCSTDLAWVKHHLLPFEVEHGMRFCLHERDWIPGWEITENIINSIEESRMIILVISNAFARSQWCHFEMTMIQVKLLQKDRDNVILILKETVNDLYMTPRLAWHMKSKTYLKWPYADYCDTLTSRNQGNPSPVEQQQKQPDPAVRYSERPDAADSSHHDDAAETLSGEFQASAEVLLPRRQQQQRQRGDARGMLPRLRNFTGEMLFWRQLEAALRKPMRSHLNAPVDQELN